MECWRILYVILDACKLLAVNLCLDVKSGINQKNCDSHIIAFFANVEIAGGQKLRLSPWACSAFHSAAVDHTVKGKILGYRDLSSDWYQYSYVIEVATCKLFVS